MTSLHRDLLFGGVIFAAGLTPESAHAQPLSNGWQNGFMSASDPYGAIATYDIYYLLSPTDVQAYLPSGTYARWQGDTSGFDIRVATVGDDSANARAFAYFDASEDMTFGIRWDLARPDDGRGSVWLKESNPSTPRLIDVDVDAHPAQGTAFAFLEGGKSYRMWVFAARATEGTASVIARPAARCDLDLNDELNIDDVDHFVMAFLAGDLLADFDATGTLNIDDIDAFVACFLGGNP